LVSVDQRPAPAVARRVASDGLGLGDASLVVEVHYEVELPHTTRLCP
jgi:hypothetical protein